MKICKKCGILTDRFEKNRLVCRKCNNRSQALRNKLRSEAMRNYIADCKSVPCTDCGNTFPTVCMDFDHLPQYEKKFGIATVSSNANVSMETLIEEIAKCEIVCANCHRIRTLQRRKN